MREKFIRSFLVSAGALLLVTALSKVISSLGADHVLETREPLFAITYRSLFRIFGALELVIALFCLFGKPVALRVGIVAWLATNCLIYRLSMPFVGYLKPCPCLGSLTNAIHISPQIADNVMKVVLTYLIIGSYASISWLWWQRKNSVFTHCPEQ